MKRWLEDEAGVCVEAQCRLRVGMSNLVDVHLVLTAGDAAHAHPLHFAFLGVGVESAQIRHHALGTEWACPQVLCLIP